MWWLGTRLVAALLCVLLLGQTAHGAGRVAPDTTAAAAAAAAGERALSAAQGCRKRRIVHTIRSPSCAPRRLLSYACHGSCSSYTQISKTLEFKRHCKCCQEMGERTALVLVRCRAPGVRALRRHRLRIKVPTDCMCRPCSNGVRVRPLEMEALGPKKWTL